MNKYIGTFVIPGQNPKDVVYRQGQFVVLESFARRKNRLVRAVDFVKACRRWWRVQRLGSRA